MPDTHIIISQKCFVIPKLFAGVYASMFGFAFFHYHHEGTAFLIDLFHFVFFLYYNYRKIYIMHNFDNQYACVVRVGLRFALTVRYPFLRLFMHSIFQQSMNTSKAPKNSAKKTYDTTIEYWIKNQLTKNELAESKRM